jgi:uncharacterized protein with von Willebrand factor type A (vWA) domain
MAAAEQIVAGFARALRANGLSVPTGSAVTYADALALVGVESAEQVYWAGRATLVRRFEDIETYERVFAAYFKDRRLDALVQGAAEGEPITLGIDEEDGSEDERGAEEESIDSRDVLALRYSAIEVLREQDLSGLTAEEWAEVQRLIAALEIACELRPSRRTRPSPRRSRGHPDLRSTIRRNMRTGGIPIRRSWRAQVERPRRLIFLLDVSGSMEPYARGLILFAHAAVASRRAGQVEVFSIGTRLTRITRQLSRRDADAALRSAAQSVSDWSGGTRLGASLQEFNDRWGVRGMARGAVVVICSDGWDRGDPELIGSEMARLARVARRVVWVNPLKASPGYAPLARGMAAALPFVDQFVEGHAVSSLEHLAEIIGSHRPRGRRSWNSASPREASQ